MIKDIVDLTELQHLLDEAAGRNTRIKPRTASLEDAQKLLGEGYTTKYVSKMTGIPESKIEKEEEERRTFVSTGRLPSKYGVHTAFSCTSWTNYY